MKFIFVDCSSHIQPNVQAWSFETLHECNRWYANSNGIKHRFLD